MFVGPELCGVAESRKGAEQGFHVWFAICIQNQELNGRRSSDSAEQ